MISFKYTQIGWRKYRADETFRIQTPIVTGKSYKANGVELDENGVLIIYEGYISDGCSGPTWDCAQSTPCCFIHDGGYDLIELGGLPLKYKAVIDFLLYMNLIENGFNPIRAKYYYLAVKYFGRFAIHRRIFRAAKTAIKQIRR